MGKLLLFPALFSRKIRIFAAQKPANGEGEGAVKLFLRSEIFDSADKAIRPLQVVKFAFLGQVEEDPARADQNQSAILSV